MSKRKPVTLTPTTIMAGGRPQQGYELRNVKLIDKPLVPYVRNPPSAWPHPVTRPPEQPS